jgi:5-formyltetrahydrofolate cyclo-ligase
MNPLPKQALRQQLRKRRAQIPEITRTEYGRIIMQQLIGAIDWQYIRRVHCYIPIVEHQEVDTWPLLRYIWRYQLCIEIAIPGPLVDDHPIAYTINSETVWSKTGVIPYPIDRHITRNAFDLVIVPCLGFDSDRYRLGYGSGYYDRFLMSQPDAIIVGVSFSAGYVSQGLPHEKHDTILSHIVTEDVTL